MKRTLINRLLTMTLALLAMSCSGNEAEAQTTSNEYMTQKLLLTIGDQTMQATLVKNSAAEALVTALAENPITYNADDYGGFEKVGALGRSLPTSNQQLTTVPGDIILYSGNQIVLFYGSNSWSYTRLGRMEYESTEQLKAFLKAGQGRVSVTLSLAGTAAIVDAPSDAGVSDGYTALNGMRMANPGKGIYIKDGKKIIR